MRKRILAVDDSRAARRLLHDYLADEYDVDTAESAKAGLELLAHTHYPVVISDINMPGQSGMDLLQTCKSQFGQTEIILITGTPQIADAVRAMRIGAFDYLEKTFTKEKLKAVVGGALERLAARQAANQDAGGTIVMDSSPQNGIATGYHTIRALGRGTNGIVLLVAQNDQHYAMKIYRSTGSPAEDAVRIGMLAREARALARIQHPGVVRIHEFGTSGVHGVPFIVMEFVDGRSLRSYIDDASLTFRQKLNILFQISMGLAEIHHNGIVHRDIKPENIMLTEALLAKIADFGISYVADATTVISDNSCIGTPGYMPPEAFERVPSLNAASDIFSLGVLGYELLAGARPFPGKTILEVIESIRTDSPADLHARCPEVSPALGAVIGKMLRKVPAERFPNGSAVVKAMAGLLTTEQA